MAAEKLRHIFLNDSADPQAFTSPQTFGSKIVVPPRDRVKHEQELTKQFQLAWAAATESAEIRKTVSLPVRSGVYVEFQSSPGFELLSKSLENRASGVRLLSVRTEADPNNENAIFKCATVYIPSTKEGYFLKRLRAYADESTETGKPRNKDLVESIEAIRLAVVESFWLDSPDLIPKDVPIWCEVWLSSDEEVAEKTFRTLASDLKVECQLGALRFPERTVILAKASRADLINLIESSNLIAEFRLAKETAHFFTELPNADQADWTKELLQRISISKTAVVVCVLDTGITNKHPLLENLLEDDDCHTYQADWGTHDHNGHGTLVSGVSAFGDLLGHFQGTHQVTLSHGLESVKILPPHGNNDQKLWGHVVSQAVSKAEIQAPERQRVFCLAVSAKDTRERGRPTSWSAEIDAISSGYDDDQKRLFIVAAGNVTEADDWRAYPDSNLTVSIHDPAQAWNAVTVGAYTQKTLITDPKLTGYVPVAPVDGLSPFSTTSLTWETNRWPVKPDLVLEGGNVLVGTDGFTTSHDDVSTLTTFFKPTQRHFASIDATSGATAQAAWLAATIQTMYPNAWPETVRALMIHSAQWTKQMKTQFLSGTKKSDYARLMRICGYGVPNFERALECGKNYLTLIAQEEIQPYEKSEARTRTKEMHLFELPFPKDVLLSLGEMEMTMRVTLSYFIEPGPGEVGWKDRYRYASHALRFDVNTAGESRTDFEKRVNAASRAEDHDSSTSGAGSDRWMIGANARKLGSLHSDFWVGTAAEISTCNMVAVYPVVGWWRERHHLGRYNRKAKYALIVSLYTPDQKVDIYTPVAVNIGIPIPI
ncbi:MAG TPA: S8 family peptidase [Bryobacteraceae bacterium]|nr:S8 family peptidase [Bryobacteraceae bacterium]